MPVEIVAGIVQADSHTLDICVRAQLTPLLLRQCYNAGDSYNHLPSRARFSSELLISLQRSFFKLPASW
jgi:hypothetical protein